MLLFLSIELKKESKVIISCHKTGTIAAFLITPAIPLVLEVPGILLLREQAFTKTLP